MARVGVTIEAGQRFKQNNTVWEVSRIIPFHGIPHASLVNVGEPTESKLISVSTLIKDSDYIRE